MENMTLFFVPFRKGNIPPLTQCALLLNINKALPAERPLAPPGPFTGLNDSLYLFSKSSTGGKMLASTSHECKF